MNTELQIALAEATRTDTKTAAAFLSALMTIAYRAVREEGHPAVLFPCLGRDDVTVAHDEVRPGDVRLQADVEVVHAIVDRCRVGDAAG